MKQQFEITDKMIEYATKKMREFDTSFNFDMDNQSRELTSEYQAVYEALPFQNLKEFERWLELDDSVYNVETVVNLMNTNKPISDFLNDEPMDIFEKFYELNMHNFEIEAEHKDLFADLCFLENFFYEFQVSLYGGDFRDKIFNMQCGVEDVLVHIYHVELNEYIQSVFTNLDDFTKDILEISAYYRKMLNR